MKTLKVWLEKNGEWVLLHEGSERIRVELDPQDRESTQIESYLFDPYANPEEALPELEIEAG